MASPSGHHHQDPTGQGQGQGQGSSQNQNQNQNQNQGQPQGRRFSYASVAAGAEHPPPRSHANPSDNAYTWLRGHIPGSSHQLPDPDITNYMFYETGMDMFIRPSDNMYGSGFSMSPDNTMAASALAFARGLDPGSATAHPPAPALLPAPAAVPPPGSNGQHSSQSPLAPRTRHGMQPPFPPHSRMFAEAPDFKVAMTASVPPNKNAFFFVPSYMKTSAYADQLREEQRVRAGLGPGGVLVPRDEETPGVRKGRAGEAVVAKAAAEEMDDLEFGDFSLRRDVQQSSERGPGLPLSTASQAAPSVGGDTQHTAAAPGAIPATATATAPATSASKLTAHPPAPDDHAYEIIPAARPSPPGLPQLPTRFVAAGNPATTEPVAHPHETQFKDVQILSDGLEISFLGSEGRKLDGVSIRTDHPMPAVTAVYYFEVEVVRNSSEGIVAVGVATLDAAPNRIPGYDGMSWGYHGDDGKVYRGKANSTGTPYGPMFGEGDVIGCGWDWKQGKAFFTKNGQFLGHVFEEIANLWDEGNQTDGNSGTNGAAASRDAARARIGIHPNHDPAAAENAAVKQRLKPPGPMIYPTVGIRGKPAMRVRGNFGQYPFRFDIDGYTAQLKREVQAQISKYTPPFDDDRIAKALVAQYLAHEGYTKTAAAFDKEMQEELVARYGDARGKPVFNPASGQAKIRNAIKEAVLRGAIDKAALLTDRYFPTAGTSDLQFKLRCQKFVELIRRAHEYEKAKKQQRRQQSRPQQSRGPTRSHGQQGPASTAAAGHGSERSGQHATAPGSTRPSSRMDVDTDDEPSVMPTIYGPHAQAPAGIYTPAAGALSNDGMEIDAYGAGTSTAYGFGMGPYGIPNASQQHQARNGGEEPVNDDDELDDENNDSNMVYDTTSDSADDEAEFELALAEDAGIHAAQALIQGQALGQTPAAAAAALSMPPPPPPQQQQHQPARTQLSSTTATAAAAFSAGQISREENGKRIYTFKDAVAYGALLERIYYADAGTGNDEAEEKVIKQRQQVLDALFGLLAYRDPGMAPSQYLMHDKFREELAEELNDACLKSTDRQPFPALERMFQQTEVFLRSLRLKGGVGSVVNVREDYLPKQ